MGKVFCSYLAVLLGLASPFPLDSDMTAGLVDSGVSLEEGIILEGDIISSKTPHSKNLILDQSELWPNKVFPYTIGSEFTNAQKFNIQTAIKDLATQTCVQFRERTNEPTYVVFKSFAKMCASVVGYSDLKDSGGVMPIYVSAPGCELRGQIQHEILHSLGFWHEHTRPDRDEHVTVHWDNVKPGFESNFEARTWTDSQTLGLPYDIESVMHYSDSAFSRDGSSTLTPIHKKSGWNMGQRFRVSKLDIAKLNRLYDCDDRYYKGRDLA